MKTSLQFLSLILLFSVCSTDDKGKVLNITQGTFFLNKELSNDILKFQAEMFDKGNWNNTVWRITSDTIYQEDSRGLSVVFGKDRRKYSFLNDTLYIWNHSRPTNKNKVKQSVDSVEKYIVLRSNEQQLEIIHVKD